MWSRMRRLRRRMLPPRPAAHPRPPIPPERPRLVGRRRLRHPRPPCLCSRSRVPTVVRLAARDPHRPARRRDNRGRLPTALMVAPAEVRRRGTRALAAQRLQDQHRLVQRWGNHGRRRTARTVARAQVHRVRLQVSQPVILARAAGPRRHMPARLAPLRHRRVLAHQHVVVPLPPARRREHRQRCSQHVLRHPRRRRHRQPLRRRQRALPPQRQLGHPPRERLLLQRRLLSQLRPLTQKHSLP
jgi:hypothetical protein